MCLDPLTVTYSEEVTDVGEADTAVIDVAKVRVNVSFLQGLVKDLLLCKQLHEAFLSF